MSLNQGKWKATDNRPINFLNLVYNLKKKLLALCVNQQKNKQDMKNTFRFFGMSESLC